MTALIPCCVSSAAPVGMRSCGCAQVHLACATLVLPWTLAQVLIVLKSKHEPLLIPLCLSVHPLWLVPIQRFAFASHSTIINQEIFMGIFCRALLRITD
jgi:hypothetical protein